MRMPISSRRPAILLPDAPQGGRRPLAHDLHPVVAGELEDALRLAEVGRDLGPDQRVADADRAVEAGRLEHRRLHLPGGGDRVVGLHAHERLVPPEHLDHGPRRRPQRLHHPRRRRLVDREVDRQEHRVGRAPLGQLERQPAADAVRAGLVGRRRHHRPLGRVAPPADHHGQPDQLRAAQQLDGDEELVHVDVEHPVLRHPPILARRSDTGAPLGGGGTLQATAGSGPRSAATFAGVLVGVAAHRADPHLGAAICRHPQGGVPRYAVGVRSKP